MRKLCLMDKIVNGCRPQYFKDYISYVDDKHRQEDWIFFGSLPLGIFDEKLEIDEMIVTNMVIYKQR